MSFISILLLSMNAEAVPQQLSQQGRLLDASGSAVSGQHFLTFRIYDEPSAVQPVWSEALTVIFNNGYYATTLGTDQNNPLDETVLSISPLYMDVEVDNNGPLPPRQILSSGPYAKMAGIAENLDGGTVNAQTVSVGGNMVIDSNGSWIGQTITVDWNQLTGIPADIADGDADTLAGLNCSQGQIVGWNGNDWICTDDNGLTEAEVENYVTNDALNFAAGSTMDGSELVTTVTDQDSMASLGLSCINDDVAKWDSVSLQWYCATDEKLSEADVENYVTNGSLDLSASTTLNGATILTSADPTIQSISCAQGEVLSYDSGSWTCTSFQSLLDSDGDGVMAWNDCDDSDPLRLSKVNDNDCDGVQTEDDCNDFDPNSNTIAEDGDCDGFLTADDCDDTDANITTQGNGVSADCTAESCLQILNSGYSTGDGNYWLDLGSGAAEYHCDMSGGGWTRIMNDDFSSGSAGWNSGTLSSCGGYGEILGGYNHFGSGASTQKTISTNVSHSEIKVNFDFVKIDTWDNETAYLEVDGSNQWSQSFHHNNSNNQCGNTAGENLSNGSWQGSHTASSVTIRFYTSIDQSPDDESWGVDNVIVYIR